MNTEVVVLTKAPIPGQVKTRLIPAIGAKRAAELHWEMMWTTLDLVSQTNLPVRISLAGDETGCFTKELHQAGYSTETQASGDLGDRMSHIAQRPGRQILLGTDCVVFDPSWILRAANSVEPISIGPSEDGGYWAVSLNGTHPDLIRLLFNDIHWSTDTVFRTTRSRLTSAGVQFNLLPQSYDIDTIEDLKRLQQDPLCGPKLQQLLSSIFRTSL
ncbi:MAG: TIGR04282 family arsenosugar biosynthesis glycosyltransferase [Myxococcota bacterium]